MMKTAKYILHALCFGVLAAGAGSCTEQFKEVGKAQEAEMISIAVKPNIMADSPDIPPLQVRFESQENSYTVTAPVSATGVTSVENIVPGKYNITISGRDETASYAGGVTQQALISTRGADNPIQIKVMMSQFGAVCFKEIFTNCSSNSSLGSGSEAYYKKDQYYEIYNNSDEVFYLDSLCITTLQPDVNFYMSEFNTWTDADADDYVYAALIWIIPGSGTDYPLQPGQSAVIASLALNHKQPTFNPDSPADLRSAEFEAWIPEMSATVSDNPALNMKIYMGTSGNIGASWFTNIYGCAYALFKATGPVIEENDVRIPIGKTRRHYRIRIDRCLDVVEVVRDEATKQNKRVSPVLDEGAITAGGIYKSISFVRKTDAAKTAAAGRIVLMDTNNTNVDFELQSPPVLRRGLNTATSIPSWNTWANP